MRDSYKADTKVNFFLAIFKMIPLSLNIKSLDFKLKYYLSPLIKVIK